jgi:hypothetical protein
LSRLCQQLFSISSQQCDDRSLAAYYAYVGHM